MSGWLRGAMKGVFGTRAPPARGVSRRKIQFLHSSSVFFVALFLLLVLSINMCYVVRQLGIYEAGVLDAPRYPTNPGSIVTRAPTAENWFLLPCLGFQEGVSRPALFCANSAASRAPLSSLRIQPLRARQKSVKPLAVGPEAPACYSLNGEATRRPSWARPLLESLVKDGVYEAVQSLLQDDAWYVLIGWVTDSFMPLQKSVKQKNGRILVPQTKGNNVSYYLEEYGNVWDTEFATDGLRFHFQLVHRHAMVVCVRERIHLFKYYCLPDANVQPIPIHVCACRKCKVPEDPPDARVLARMHERFPAFSEPRLIGLAKTIHFTLSPTTAVVGDSPSNEREDTCIDAFEAPWLLNTTLIPAFPYEGKYNDLDSLLRTQVDAHGLVTVVIFNIYWRDHLHNFVYSFTRNANMHNLIVATLDDAALLLCRSFRLPCFNASMFVEAEESDGDPRDTRRGFVRKVTEMMSWVKPRLVIAVLRRGYAILMSDLDITWNRSPMAHLMKRELDITHQCDSPYDLSINSGLYMARPNTRTLGYFVDLMYFRPDETPDQDAMRLLAKYNHLHNMSHKCLPKSDFSMKCDYKRKDTEISIKGKKTFKWRAYPVDKPPKWVMMHATCLSGAWDKVIYLKTIKAWFLDELDNKTGTLSSPKPFCAVLPVSPGNETPKRVTVHHVFGTTPHSEHYHEMQEDHMYLRSRH